MKNDNTQKDIGNNSAQNGEVFDPFAPKTPDPRAAQNTSPSSTAVMEAINPADAAAYAAAHAANAAAQNED